MKHLVLGAVFAALSAGQAHAQALGVTIATTNVSCNGGANGTATATATGGSGLYTYVWTPENGTFPYITGLIRGSYTVTVTDNLGATAEGSATVSQPELVVITPSVTDASPGGANGQVTVHVTGGTAPFTYLWSSVPEPSFSHTVTGLSAGTYRVTVTDNNTCQYIRDVTVGTAAAPAPVPTLSDWAMILFGLVLAGGASLFIQRRRMA